MLLRYPMRNYFTMKQAPPPTQIMGEKVTAHGKQKISYRQCIDINNRLHQNLDQREEESLEKEKR